MILPDIKFPELFFGFVAPMGTDITPVISSFRKSFEDKGYQVIEIKVTDVFPVLAGYIEPHRPLVKSPLHDRYETYIEYGDQLREHSNDDSILAAAAVSQVVRSRVRQIKTDERDPATKRVFLLYQFKRKEEIELLRSVYGRLFFQVSLYSRRGARVDYLSRKFARSEDFYAAHRYRDKAEKLIEADENEADKRHGQRVSKIFHDADFIVSLDAHDVIYQQVDRFVELLFGNNSISPTRYEYGMFLAKAAALRTLDLSRQVGAAIFSPSGEVVSLGSNEVPRAGGGTYWCDDPHDDREFHRNHDSNDQRKREILSELIRHIIPDADVEEMIKRPGIIESQFMDALEYGRIVHAEMSAISDAARIGRSTKDATLYCTTFPCHMCAKHIVASGIANVIFLEPYPKSLASSLHADSLSIEQADRGRYQGFPKVEFSHFHGISPRRYREFFERGKRKSSNGQFELYPDNTPAPFIKISAPYYYQLEEIVIKFLVKNNPAFKDAESQ
ncbi:anti-phage dCTP deaminase [Aureimonas altamirensis]|uniref:anti-phage dCTP deaminase n=1 Tax=Aureimonas altamirensis TaxID=370622 RepID=UPI003015C64A